MQVIPYNQAADPYQYYGQALSSMFSGLDKQYQQGLLGGDIQARQQYQRNQQVAQQAATATSGLGGQVPSWPGAQPQYPQMRSQMGQQMAMQNMFADPFGKPPWWVQDATQQQIQDYRNRVGGPLVQIGERLLSPADRMRGAQADLEKKFAQKPLTPTELKSVRDTIKEIVGVAKGLPFGVRGGFAFKQQDMNAKWESVMESTGYDALDEVARKQIENEFDRYVAVLNKGRGTFTLANQYQWDRKKYGRKLSEGQTGKEFIINPFRQGNEPTAIDAKTGKRMIKRGGLWYPLEGE